MTRRLGGIQQRTSLAALASLTLAATLACGGAMIGCGGDDNGPPNSGEDGGSETSVIPDAGHDVTTPVDANTPDAKPVEAGPVCATPTFAPGMGAVAAGTTVAISAAGLPAGGFIYYTTDGTIPTHASPTYSTPIVIDQTETLHAISFASNACSDSNVATAIYTVALSDAGGPDVVTLPQCTEPVFAPGSGSIASGSTVAITAANLPAGGFIFYTTDGTLPTHSSPAYSGPIQVSQNETIHALAYASGSCNDSTIQVATYTVTTIPPEAGASPMVPVFNPPAQGNNNNPFTLSLSSTTGATICYTSDVGSLPSCNTTGATAQCSGTSATYNAGAGINIGPSITNATTGQVTVTALACLAGAPPSASLAQTYTLQAAAPTMTNPSMGTVPWVLGIKATLASSSSGASLYATNDGTTPQCGVLSQLQASNPVLLPLTSTTYKAIACETGFAPSAVQTFAYSVKLTTPVLTPTTGTFTTADPVTIDDTANVGSGDWVCASQGPPGTITSPVCGATASTCTAGANVVLTAGKGTVTIAASGNELQAQACAPSSYTSSDTTTSGVYTLQLSPPFVIPVGFVGTPTSSYSVLAATSVQIGQTGLAPAAPPAFGAGYACYTKNPAAGTALACSTDGTNTCTSGTKILLGTSTGAVTFNGGDSIAVVLCGDVHTDGYLESMGVTVLFVGAGTATSPAFSPIAGTESVQTAPVLINQNLFAETACYTTDALTVPTCSAGVCTAGTAVTLDGEGSAILGFTVTSGGSGYLTAPTLTLTGGSAGPCAPVATVSGGAITGITVGTCAASPTNQYGAPPVLTIPSGSGASVSAALTQTLTFTVTNPGSGYSIFIPVPPVGTFLSLPPTVTLVGGGGTCTSVIATSSADAAGNVTGITATGCTNFTSAPDVVLTGNASATASLSTADSIVLTPVGGAGYTSAPAIALVGGGGTCTTAPVAGLGIIGNVTIATQPTGCTGFTSAPTVTLTGGGVGATATVSVSNMAAIPALQANPTTVAAVACNAGEAAGAASSALYNFQLAAPTFAPATGATVNVGASITVSTTSNFSDTAIGVTTDGSAPTCPAAPTGSSISVPIPSTVGSVTVRAIACGAAQLSSAITGATYTVQVAQPTIVSSVGATTLVPGPLGLISAQNSPVTAIITSPSPGTYLCYNNNATPSCSGSTATGCDVNSTKAVSGVMLTIVNSGFNLQAIACLSGTQPSAVTAVTYDLNITPVVFGVATGTCPQTATIGFDPTAATLAGDALEAGPTTGASVCYSTTVSFVGCPAVPGPGVTCFIPTGGADTQTVSLTTNTTILAHSCLAGFTGETLTDDIASLVPYESVAPAITVDGTIDPTEWSTTIGDQFASGTAGIFGGFTLDAVSDSFFETNGYTSAVGTDVVVYIGDGIAAGGLTTQVPTLAVATPVPFAAKWAFIFDTNADTTSAFMVMSGGWVSDPTLAADVAANFDFATGVLEVGGIPIADFGNTTPATIEVSGGVVTGAGTGAAALIGAWPQSAGAWGFVNFPDNTCHTPAFQVQ